MPAMPEGFVSGVVYPVLAAAIIGIGALAASWIRSIAHSLKAVVRIEYQLFDEKNGAIPAMRKNQEEMKVALGEHREDDTKSFREVHARIDDVFGFRQERSARPI